MHHHARRSAGFIAALAAGTLIVAGCTDDSDNDNAAATATTGPMATMTTTAGADETTTGAEGGTTTGTAGATTSPGGEDSEAGEQTRMATPDGTEVTVSGDIYDKYMAVGGPSSPLGAPLQAEEAGPNGGKYQDFVGGTIYEPAEGEPHIVWGEIRKAWEANGGANGELGYPTSDETDIPGGKQSTFTGGTITWVNGQTNVTMR
ncbi:esterase [Nocardia farcinica]|uniref:LGFP repeat n=2 Tax=Nocardia farcinica TaxID=37329 RepID=A0A449GIV6_NOCFR|nr:MULTISPECIES: esterase [Nocardia]SLH71269.1 LGFP repeat-containing protein [Mycobacteroides abscessus subsp. abscessus]MBF6069265.1 esterase [Nocardia farcinica]MBF6187671.1 esterase [Nocardia farcinica]MBF6233146.1 esterase [Nocardia farcinica]MBF6264294.1 esterase [Nocardia farcinica]